MRPSQRTGAAPKITVPSPACLVARDDLMPYIDGELDDARAASVAAHLHECARCQQADTSMRHLIAALRTTHLPVLASRHLRFKIVQLLAIH